MISEEYIQMKKSLHLICLALAALILFSSCARGNKFAAEGLGFVDKKTNITYNFAPLCYEPIILGDKIYGSDGDIDFYEIMGQDPQMWLGDADGGVFYAQGITLPTLDKMNVTRIEICTVGSALLVRDRITEPDQISAIITEYMSEEKLIYPNTAANASYKLRFADSSLDIYYCLEFFRYSGGYITTKDGKEINHGTDFLYNRSEDRFVKAPLALSEYINALIGDSD